MQMKQKRGINQVDWAISLGIFLVYLAWFFLFVKPLVAPRALAALTPTIKDSFDDYTEWTVQKVPVIVLSNITGNMEPIIVNMSNHNKSHLSFTNKRYYVIDYDKVFFLGNLTEGGNIFWMVNSSLTYTKETPVTDLISTSTYASTPDFRANFVNGLLASLQYKTKSRIKSFDFLVNDASINKSSNSYSNEKIFAKYGVSADVNNTFYVFSNNKKVYGYFKPKQPTSSEIKLSFSLDNYTNYYANEYYKRTFDYSKRSCDDFDSNFVNFYDSSDSITIVTDVHASMEVCNTNDTISFNAVMNLTGDHWYKIILSDDNYLATLTYAKDYFAQFGFAEEIDGISSAKLDELKGQPYTTMKRSWDVTDNNNFKITVTNSTSNLLTYGDVPYAAANVFVEEYNMWLVDEYTNEEKVKVNIQTW